MKDFLDKDFLLKTTTAKRLFHDYAADMPIIDYHCHLSPKDIAEDRIFNNIAEVWLHGDQYKWRAMRTNGIHESYCTGDKPDLEKFEQWAATVPYTMRNPLYHWTHMELQRYFNVTEQLSPANAKAVYEHCNALLQTQEFSVRNLLRKMKVKLVCTTDDPVDSLEYHKAMQEEGADIKMVPAFRPDMAMNVGNTETFLQYVRKVEAAAGMQVNRFEDYLMALKRRHDFFAQMGCRVSDHGLEEIYADDHTAEEIIIIFERLLSNASDSSSLPCWCILQNGTTKKAGCSNSILAHSGTTIPEC
jgi:glucuronate isomerase